MNACDSVASNLSYSKKVMSEGKRRTWFAYGRRVRENGLSVKTLVLHRMVTREHEPSVSSLVSSASLSMGGGVVSGRGRNWTCL